MERNPFTGTETFWQTSGYVVIYRWPSVATHHFLPSGRSGFEGVRPRHSPFCRPLGLPSFRSLCTKSTRSSMVQTLRPHLSPNLRQLSRRIIPPPLRSDDPTISSPSSTSSQMTPAGRLLASRQNSTAASVCPFRSRIPPDRARSGKTCPGRRNDEDVDF